MCVCVCVCVRLKLMDKLAVTFPSYFLWQIIFLKTLVNIFSSETDCNLITKLVKNYKINSNKHICICLFIFTFRYIYKHPALSLYIHIYGIP